MNTDQKLRRLLTDAADSFDPSSRGRPQQAFWERRTVQVIAAAVVGCLVIVALGFVIANVHSGHDGASSSASSASSKSSSISSSERAPAAVASAGSGTTSKSSSVPNQADRVVQTGQLALEVARGQVSPVLAKLTTIADSAGGYISQSRDDDSQILPSGTSTLRVPVTNFDAVTTQVRRLGAVTSASSQARNVTSEYVDLGARITALEQERATFYTLLTRATTIGDTLAVQQQIQPLQTQLEQLQGQQKVLADSSDLATLIVSVVQKGGTAVIPAKHSSNGFAKSLRQTGHAFNTGLQGIISALGPILLVLIVLGVLGGLGLLGRRMYRTLTR
jgi:hypothetical protein